MKKRNYGDAIFALEIYSVAVALSFALGFHMRVHEEYGHLLNREFLVERLGESLFYLHAQPPILNLIFGLLLKASRATGWSVEALATVVQVGLGGVAALGMAALAARMIRRGWRRRLCIALMAAHPVLHASIFNFFYTLHELTLLLLIPVFLHRFWRRRRVADFGVLCGLVVLLVYTRTLFHPLWAVATLGIALWPVGRRVRAGVWTCAACAVVAIGLWPMKNQIVFGKFTATTWGGFNLAQGLGIDGEALEAIEEEIPERFAGVAALEVEFKRDATRNMNHFGVIAACEAMGARARAAMRARPGVILEKAAKNYWRFTRFSGRQPYVGYLGPYHEVDPRAGRWLRVYEAIFNQDFRGREALDSVDARIHPAELLDDYPQEWGFAPFMLTFPALLAIAALKAWRMRRRRRLQARTAAFMLFCILWVLASALLIDGAEGNRLRFSTEPYLFVLGFWLLSGARRTRRPIL